MPPVELRPPRLLRAYVVVFTVLWCAGVATAGVRGLLAGQPSALVTLPMLGLGALLGFRLSRLGVRADGRSLTVRNNWSSRVLSRDDIEGFRTSPTSGSLPFAHTVQVLLRDQTVLPLDVTTQALPLRRSRTRLLERVEQLRAWHAQGR